MTTSIGATRYESLVRDLPVAVNVIPSEFINDAGFKFGEEAIEYTAGVTNRVSVESSGFGGVSATMRGHATLYSYRNGYIHYHKNEASVIDRIEVLKGPAAMNYGSVYPGGVVNAITKKPLPGNRTTLEATGGPDYERFVLDENQVLIPGQLTFRLIGTNYSEDSYIDNVTQKLSLLYPALRWQIGPNTRLDVSYEYDREDGNLFTNVIRKADGTPLDSVGPHFNAFNKDAVNDARLHIAEYEFTHRFNSIFSVRQSLSSFRRVSVPSYAVTDSQLGADNRTFKRTRISKNDKGGYDSVVAQLDLLAEYHIPLFLVKTKLGAEHRESISYGNRWDASTVTTAKPLAIDIFGPRDQFNVSNFTFNTLGAASRRFQNFTSWSVGNILTTLDQGWTVLLALRNESIYNDDRQLDPVTHLRQPSKAGAITYTKRSPQLGFSHRLTNDVSLYSSFSTGWRADSVRDYDGVLNHPETSWGWDVGAKFGMIKGTVSGTLAYYEVTRSGVYRADTDKQLATGHSPYYTISGQEFARGVELDMVTLPMGNNVQLVTGTAWTQAFVKTSTYAPTDPSYNVGVPLPQAPKFSFSQFARYSPKSPGLKGLSGSIGVRYSGEYHESVDANKQNRITPASTVADATLGYSFKLREQQLRLQLDVRNIFDRSYRTSDFWAEPRNWRLSAATTF